MVRSYLLLSRHYTKRTGHGNRLWLDSGAAADSLKTIQALAGLFGLAFGGIWFLFVMFASSIGIAGTVLWIWMLVEVLTRETDEGNNKLIWSLVIIFTHWVGALIYIFVRRKQRIAETGR